MSLAAISWVFCKDIRPLSLKVVMIALADNAGPTGEAWPSLSVISRKCSLDRRTVIRALDELENRGLITDTGRRTGRTSRIKIYKLTGADEVNSDILPPLEMVTSDPEMVTSCPVMVASDHLEPKEPKEPNKLYIKEQRLKRPTREMVELFFKDDPDEAERFWDYYQSNGWKVGRNPMKDWEATARRWSRNNQPRTPVMSPQHRQNRINYFNGRKRDINRMITDPKNPPSWAVKELARIDQELQQL
jgi:predicted transcriptional regulator